MNPSTSSQIRIGLARLLFCAALATALSLAPGGDSEQAMVAMARGDEPASGSGAAESVRLSEAHVAAVNRRRRIYVNNDVGYDAVAMGPKLTAIRPDEWIAARFSAFDQPGSQVDCVGWCLDEGNIAAYPSTVIPELQYPTLLRWRAEGVDIAKRIVEESHQRKADGMTPSRAWKTYASREFRGGDTVLFKRGSVFRGVLHTRNGTDQAPITYGAYGEGDKPVFLGSVPANNPEHWVQERRLTGWTFNMTKRPIRREGLAMRKAIHTLVITATTVGLALPLDEGLARQPETAAKPIDVGSQSQLFVDRYLIESEKAIELVVHPPKKMERVLVPEKPWEAYRVFVQSVLRDGDVYRMYYSCIPSKPAGKGETIKCRNCGRQVPDNTVICQCGWCPSSELQQRMFGNLAYAESQDGIHWEKPDLGLREFDGNKSNNLLPNAGPVVSMVPEPVQGMRFLSLPATDDIIRLSGSRDGRTFEVLAEGLSPFLLDTANQILWDPNHEKYVAYLRGFPGRRVVVRAEIDDPTKSPWPHNEGADLNVKKGSKYVTTELPIVMDGNTLGTYEIYNPALNIYPHRKGGVYLAFPTVYRAYPRQPDRPHHNYNKAPNDGMGEIYLLVSRDGKNFTIPAKTAYVSPGTEEEPDRGYLSMAVGMIENGDELWQYYTGVEVTHGVVDPDRRSGTGGAYRLVQKRDRFAGVRAGHAGGEIVIQPLVFSGNRLEINVDCGGLGEAWVEILDEAGRPIPGFEMDRFDVIDMNHVHAPCAWMENPDVGQLAGRPVKLRFKLRAATLYSFRFFQ